MRFLLAFLMLFQAGCAAQPDEADVAKKGVAIARQAEESGEYGIAAMVLGGLRARGHAKPDAPRDEARLLLLDGQSKEALAILETLPSMDAMALNTLGVAHDMLGQHAEARAAYHRALAQRPDDLTVLANLALSLVLDDRPSVAAGVVGDAGARRLIAAQRFWDVALVQLAAGQPEQALETLRVAGRGDSAAADLIRLSQILALSPVQRRAALLVSAAK